MMKLPPLVYVGPYYRYHFHAYLQRWVPMTAGGELVLTQKQRKRLLTSR